MEEMTLKRAVELLNERKHLAWDHWKIVGSTVFGSDPTVGWNEKFTSAETIAIASYPELRAENKALRAALKTMHAGLKILNDTVDHHGGFLDELDEDVAEAFLAYRRVASKDPGSGD